MLILHTLISYTDIYYDYERFTYFFGEPIMKNLIHNVTIARRKFLTTTAGIAMFDLPALLGADDPFSGLPIGIQSYSLRGFGLHDAIRHIQAMGLHHVEFYQKHVPQDIAGENLKALNQLLTTADINMVAHGVSGFNNNHDKNKSIFDLNQNHMKN